MPLLRADHREHRLGGAASVATMLRALGAERHPRRRSSADDPEGIFVRGMLTKRRGSMIASSETLDDRPTTLKERYIGRAQDRHPQQMIRVDYEVRDPIPAASEVAARRSVWIAAIDGVGHRPDLRLRQRASALPRLLPKA